MKEYWSELHKINFKYVPTKSDDIDTKLAEVINKQETYKRMQYLFVRESEGHYNYFKSKVIMSIKGDNLILRVGGGFMQIHQFVEQHNPINRNNRNDSTPHPFQLPEHGNSNLLASGSLKSFLPGARKLSVEKQLSGVQ